MESLLSYKSDWQGNITFSELGLKFRSLRPADLYKIEFDDLNLLDICRYLCLNKKIFDSIPYSVFTRLLFPILEEELITGRIYKVKDWLRISYQLLNKNWGSNLDWLEKQPMDKINVMIEVVLDSRETDDGIDMLEG